MNQNFPQIDQSEAKNVFIGLREILTVLFKHQQEIIGIFIFFTILSLIVPMMMTSVYQAESSLLVKVGREHLNTQEIGDQVPRISFDVKTLIEPEIVILRSRDLIEKVIENIGLEKIYPKFSKNDSSLINPLETAIIKFHDDLAVFQSSDSNVIKVAFQHQDPEIAKTAVNLLAEYWKEKHLAIFSNSQASFLEDQVKEYRKNLEESETVLQQFKRDHGISSILEQRGLLLKQRQDLDSILKSNENQVQGLGTKINSLQGQLKHIPQNIPILTVNEQKHEMLDDAKSELLALKRKEQVLLSKYQENNRMVTDIREEISLIQAFIKEQEIHLKDQVTRGRNPIYQDLKLQLINSESELSSLESKNTVTLGQIEAVERQIAQLNQLEKEFDGLQREVNKDQENLKMYLEKVEAAHVYVEMDRKQIANVSVIQSASTPIKPIKPKKILIFLLGMCLGAISGVFWAFATEYFQGFYSRPEQAALEQGIPVLVSISHKT
jgi:uncharacterized protein involved in exopolysaccharide biosynthesis